MKFFYHSLGSCAEISVHRQGAEKRVILRDAVQLALNNAHIFSAGTHAQRRAGVAVADVLDVLRAHNFNVIAVIIAQDRKRVAPLFGQRHGAPLLHALAAHLLAIAVFGVIGVDGARFADVGVEDVIGDANHHIEHRAAVHIILVVTGGVGDIERIALAFVPLGINAVQRNADLRMDIGAQRLLRPGGVDFAGGDIGDIIAERNGYIACAGSGLTQMDGDFFGDDGRLQNARRRALGRRHGGAAAITCPQRVGGNYSVVRLHIQANGALVFAKGDHGQFGHGRLTVKNLHACNAHRFIAIVLCHQVVYAIGTLGVGLVQGKAAGRACQRQGGKQAVLAGLGRPFCAVLPCEGKAHARHGQSVPGGIAARSEKARAGIRSARGV